MIRFLFFWLMSGSITFYPTHRFEGNPLYCSHYDGQPYSYDQETAEKVGPWVALDVGLYESGVVRCGQELVIIFEDGSTLAVVALDAGRFSGYYVQSWPALPIVADVPEYWQSESRKGVVIWLTGNGG